MPEKTFDQIGDSEIGKPYRGKMVVHISVELTKIDEEKCRVKRFTTLEDGFIIVEDTLRRIGDIVLEWGPLPPMVIGVPLTDPALAKGNKDNIKKKDPKSAEQEELRRKAREKLAARGVKLADPKKAEEKKKPDTMQIYVKKEDGLRIPVKVTPSTTIAEIKEMVEDKAEVPAEEQHFDYEGTELEDDRKTVEDYGIKKGHTLDLIARPMKINVKRIDGELIPVCVSPSKTIEDVKKKVEEMDGIPVGEQNMEFGGKPLENSPTLQDCGVQDGDTIDLIPDPITVIVKKIDGTTVTLDNVNPLKNSILDLKKMVEDKESIPVDDQNMEFNDKPLDNDSSLVDYDIKDGQTIELQPDPITIKIKKIDGTTFDLPNVNPLKTKISDVKKMVEDKESIPVGDQNLEFKEEPLDDGETLLDNNIKDGDMLCLVPDPITVKFRLPDGKTVELKDVNPLKSIEQVKELLGKQESIPPKDQHPEYDGEPLKDSKSLLDCGVEDGDTIDLVIPINVKTVEGKVVPLMVSPFKSIEDIKKEMQAKENIPVETQNMQFDGNNLKNPKTLLDYKIKAGDTIELVPDPNPIALNFKKPDGTTVTLDDVSPLKTMAEVKKMLHEQEGIPPEKQHMEYEGDPIDDTQTVQDYGMKDGDTIDLVPMEIKLKHWTGATLYFKVEPDMTVDQLKDLIEKKPPKIKKADQNLQFNDDMLTDDGKTLSDCGIKHGDMIKTLKSPKASATKKEDDGGKPKSYLTPEWREEKEKLYGTVKATYYKTDYSGENDASFMQGVVKEEIEEIEFSEATTKTKINPDGTTEKHVQRELKM